MPPADPSAQILPAWLSRLVTHARLPWWLAIAAMLLTSHSLWMGFHLDDYIHRYLLSDLPGAADLLRAYESPFGVANGEPLINRWQVEHGYAPWWIDRDLLVSLWRPISYATHELDALLWPDNAFAMHAINLLWFGALVVVVTRLYRQVMGPTAIAGLASLFYALSHTNGFAVGWIANRNALVSAGFGVLALTFYDRGRSHGGAARLLSPLCLIAALLSGEGSVAVLGYMLAHAMFLDTNTWRARLIALSPHVAIVVTWRVVYNFLGHGAHGSGLYLDPIREPLAFAIAATTRLPLLIMGQLAIPPAEGYVLGPPAWAPAILMFAWVVTALFALSVFGLARADRVARFWLAGVLFALVPNCTTYANNRLLFFVGIGAMGLLAQLWIGFLSRAVWVPSNPLLRALAHTFVGAAAFLHLFISPLLLPLATQSVAFTRPINPALAELTNDSDLAHQDLLLLTAPEYFYVKLIPVMRALAHEQPAHAIHALSYGPVATQVRRVDTHTLVVDYDGGILPDITTQLYRRADIPMHVGERFDYAGVEVEVLAIEADGRANQVRFRFARSLDSDVFRVMNWNGEAFVATQLPKVGDAIALAPAPLPLKIP